MKKLVLAVIAASCLAATSVNVQAYELLCKGKKNQVSFDACKKDGKFDKKHGKKWDKKKKHEAVPEIDAAGAAIALALVAGVLSIARERRK